MKPELFRLAAAQGTLTIEMLAGHLKEHTAAAINEVDPKSKRTALHYAVEYGRINVIKLLVKEGAEVDCLDKDNKTPLHLACENRLYNAIEALLEFYPDTLKKDSKNETALMMLGKHNQTTSNVRRHEHILGLIKADMLNRTPLSPNQIPRFTQDGSFTILKLENHQDAEKFHTIMKHCDSSSTLNVYAPNQQMKKPEPILPVGLKGGILPSDLPIIDRKVSTVAILSEIPSSMFSKKSTSAHYLKQLKKALTDNDNWQNDARKIFSDIEQNKSDLDPSFLKIVSKIKNEFDRVTQERSKIKFNI